MRLGIVGHAAEKFTEVTAKTALVAMGEAMFRHKATQVVSGGCHMGGVDIWAKGKAISLGVSVVEFVPTKRTWSGPGGYQERNLQIAEYCEEEWVPSDVMFERRQCVKPSRRVAACDAVQDIGLALGYGGGDYYNDACMKRPAQVRRRLKRLK